MVLDDELVGFFGTSAMKTRVARPAKRLLADDSGQDLIEYALIAALIALGAIVAMKSLSNKISNEFNTIGSSL